MQFHFTRDQHPDKSAFLTSVHYDTGTNCYIITHDNGFVTIIAQDAVRMAEQILRLDHEQNKPLHASNEDCLYCQDPDVPPKTVQTVQSQHDPYNVEDIPW